MGYLSVVRETFFDSSATNFHATWPDKATSYESYCDYQNWLRQFK